MPKVPKGYEKVTVPIGLKVSERDYRRLKRWAGKEPLVPFLRRLILEQLAQHNGATDAR